MDERMNAQLEGKLEAGTPYRAQLKEFERKCGIEYRTWNLDHALTRARQEGYLQCREAEVRPLEAKYRALAELVEATALRLEHPDALSYSLSTLAKRLRTALSGGTDD